MDVAYISALSALAGSVIGGLTTGVTTWMSQRSQAKAALVAHDIAQREALYKEFIASASKIYGEAIVSNQPGIQDIVSLYAMVSTMRVFSSPRIVECADRIMNRTIDTFFEPNKTIRDLHAIIKKGGEDIDPLKEFSNAAREELRLASHSRWTLSTQPIQR
ncbi:MAG: hypothetical protein JOZ30_02215 [Hyphomicrobiales bacterium]|nr:hypothetical protein [Hyphomicrobiales bacterium]